MGRFAFSSPVHFSSVSPNSLIDASFELIGCTHKHTLSLPTLLHFNVIFDSLLKREKNENSCMQKWKCHYFLALMLIQTCMLAFPPVGAQKGKFCTSFSMQIFIVTTTVKLQKDKNHFKYYSSCAFHSMHNISYLLNSALCEEQTLIL